MSPLSCYKQPKTIFYWPFFFFFFSSSVLHKLYHPRVSAERYITQQRETISNPTSKHVFWIQPRLSCPVQKLSLTAWCSSQGNSSSATQKETSGSKLQLHQRCSVVFWCSENHQMWLMARLTLTISYPNKLKLILWYVCGIFFFRFTLRLLQSLQLSLKLIWPENMLKKQKCPN